MHSPTDGRLGKKGGNINEENNLNRLQGFHGHREDDYWRLFHTLKGIVKSFITRFSKLIWINFRAYFPPSCRVCTVTQLPKPSDVIVEKK